VRKGGTLHEGGTVSHENPVWVLFARAMAPMMAMPAEAIASAVGAQQGMPMRVLDIAAGHGLFGIAIARQNPNAHVTAVDWPQVLEVAGENARSAGVADRYYKLPGDAFEVKFDAPYDVVLITNFLHHFDKPTCEAFLRKVRSSLAPGGRAVTLEFVPNEDRVTPPAAAGFAMVMLGSTPSGRCVHLERTRNHVRQCRILAVGKARNTGHAAHDHHFAQRWASAAAVGVATLTACVFPG